MTKKHLSLLIALFAVWTLIARFLPHAPNATPVGALALFAGAYLSRRWGAMVPIAVLLVSDAWLGGYELPIMISVYGSFVAIAFIGSFLRRSHFVTRIFVGPLASSTLFFLTTNFAVWAATPWYTKNFAGLMTSYTLALPFWRNMLVGDIVYAAVFFGIAALFTKHESVTNLRIRMFVKNSCIR